MLPPPEPVIDHEGNPAWRHGRFYDGGTYIKVWSPDDGLYLKRTAPRPTLDWLIAQLTNHGFSAQTLHDLGFKPL